MPNEAANSSHDFNPWGKWAEENIDQPISGTLPKSKNLPKPKAASKDKSDVAPEESVATKPAPKTKSKKSSSSVTKPTPEPTSGPVDKPESKESQYKEIVDPLPEQTSEKLPEKNTESHKCTYISRMETLIKEHGNDPEKRLWSLSVSKLIVNPENITDSYWKSQEQILQDNGQDRNLGQTEKQILIESIQNKQRESLASWSDYLGDEETPYPMWFKVFAWDGMSKMGAFDKEHDRFSERDEHTVAPYPRLNPAVLAKVYEVMSIAHGDNPSGESLSSKVTSLAKANDFNGLYSHFLLNQKVTPKTPERAEDVHGEWIEYNPGDEEALAAAAEGTPWSIASPAVSRNYLLFNKSSAQEEAKPTKNKSHAKFLLFHLTDPDTGQPSPSACASIRLNTDGDVAEISGLNEGQALEDSLVPVVEEKVKTLPGGEAFLKKFADKKQLITLDHKLQTEEDLTQEELEFLYELHRPIERLDTYKETDPRIPELKAKYTVVYAIEHGVPVDEIVAKMTADEIAEHLDNLLSHGADVDELVRRMRARSVDERLDTLLAHGANVQKMLELMGDPEFVEKNLAIFYSHNTDVNILIPYMFVDDVAFHIDALRRLGAKITLADVFEQIAHFTPPLIETLLHHGINIDTIIPRMHPLEIADNINYFLLGLKANADIVTSNLLPSDVLKHREFLIKCGASPDLVKSIINEYRKSA